MTTPLSKDAAERWPTPYPKFPDVKVQLTGTNGNAYAIIGNVNRALRRAGYGDQVEAFTAEAMSGDYNNVLATAMRWVDVS